MHTTWPQTFSLRDYKTVAPLSCRCSAFKYKDFINILTEVLFHRYSKRVTTFQQVCGEEIKLQIVLKQIGRNAEKCFASSSWMWSHLTALLKPHLWNSRFISIYIFYQCIFDLYALNEKILPNVNYFYTIYSFNSVIN